MCRRLAIRYALMLVVAMIARAEIARGQGQGQGGPAVMPPTHSSEVCDPNGPPSARPYERCALLFDGNLLRRGSKGEVIAKEGLTPMPLRDIVVGDSAKFYAGRYEEDAWIASTLGRMSTAAFVSAFVGQKTLGCHSFLCINGAKGHGVRVVAVSAASLAVLSLPFSAGAKRHGARAVWWNNLLLLR